MFSHILVPVDLDEPSSWAKAVPVAQALAQSFGASVTLCTIVPDKLAVVEAPWTSVSLGALMDKTTTRLHSLSRELGVESFGREVGCGNIAGGILAIAGDVGADLIALSSHRPEMKDWLLGANAARVARHAKCSVLIVRE